MPSKARLKRNKILNLAKEQAQDRGYVYSEKIRPGKLQLPYDLTPTEYFHLVLSQSALTLEEIAAICKVTPETVTTARWRAYKKIGPEMRQHWQKICKIYKNHSLFRLPANDAPQEVNEKKKGL